MQIGQTADFSTPQTPPSAVSRMRSVDDLVAIIIVNIVIVSSLLVLLSTFDQSVRCSKYSTWYGFLLRLFEGAGRGYDQGVYSYRRWRALIA